MPRFQHGSVEIAFLDEGEGEPIVLIHGFASTKEVNWVNPGWVATLTRAGRRAIALDNRGHGASSKRYDPLDYHVDKMADDVRALMDHLGLDRCDTMGYSLGARIGAFLAVQQPDRVRSLILAGLGIHLVEDSGSAERIVAALEAPSVDAVTDPGARTYRVFAEETKGDLKALAACIRGARQMLTRDQVGAIGMPVLIAVGTKDTAAGSAHALAASMPSAEVLDIPGRDHMRAVGDKVFKSGALDFLARRP